MRAIKYIVLHCTAGPQTQTVIAIQAYWRNKLGWKGPGYHHLIEASGKVHDLQPIENPTNGVAGYNANSIHISYIGGVNAGGKAVDNRTDEQRNAMLTLIAKYKGLYPNAVVLGHRDFSRDQNGNGKVDAWERIKECPCFDVRDWLKEVGLERTTRPTRIVYKYNEPLINDSNVGVIQRALNRFGSSVKVDDYFGKGTDAAVKAFQAARHLPVTGIVDAATQAALSISLI